MSCPGIKQGCHLSLGLSAITRASSHSPDQKSRLKRLQEVGGGEAGTAGFHSWAAAGAAPVWPLEHQGAPTGADVREPPRRQVRLCRPPSGARAAPAGRAAAQRHASAAAFHPLVAHGPAEARHAPVVLHREGLLHGRDVLRTVAAPPKVVGEDLQRQRQLLIGLPCSVGRAPIARHQSAGAGTGGKGCVWGLLGSGGCGRESISADAAAGRAAGPTQK
jgi:hypothetical protein